MKRSQTIWRKNNFSRVLRLKKLNFCAFLKMCGKFGKKSPKMAVPFKKSTFLGQKVKTLDFVMNNMTIFPTVQWAKCPLFDLQKNPKKLAQQ